MYNIVNFNVESERNYDIYKVRIEGFKGSINNVSCTCPQFKSTRSCKHLAACLINYRDEIFHLDPKERLMNLSLNI